MVSISVGPLCVANFSLSSFAYLQYLRRCLRNSMCLGPRLFPYLDNMLSAYIIVINVYIHQFSDNSSIRVLCALFLLIFCRTILLRQWEVAHRIWQFLFLCSCQVSFFYNFRDHPCLIHIIIKVFVECDTNTNEFLVRTVRYCIFMLVEVLDEGIPLVCDVLRSEPAKVVAVGYDKYRLVIYPLVKKL